MPATPPARRLLFVCMGNICRSPAAEGVMRALLTARGLDGAVEVDSAGTTDYHAGEPTDPRMQGAAARRGYRLDGQARQLTAKDLERFDLVIAMDRHNLEDVLWLKSGHNEHVRLLSDFLPRGAPRDVPDPYNRDDAAFERVLDLLEQACPAILDHLLADAPGPRGGPR